MDPVTPKQPRSLPPVDAAGAEDTAVSTPVAPWDPGAPDTTPGVTQRTRAVVLADEDLAPGTQLGEYRLAEKIGQGGMGVVYAAVHPLIGKRAAIKILKQELCADPGTLERFIDEARVVNQIGHPNIVDVFAFGEMPDGRSYFVMEWLKGETLRARIARARLTLDEVRAIIKPLARALQAAHDKGVIHRDLKPDNVFLVSVPDELPTAKLLDFGIAKLAKSDHRVEKTATGAIVGTPQYIAPEQAKGYAIDPRADIYALGAILFELLTGRPPFVADNAMEMVAKHLMEAPVRPSSIERSIAPDLDELVLRMLAKTPDRRPTLAEVVAVLERSRTSGATMPFDRPTPPPPNTDRSGPVAAIGAALSTPAPRPVASVPPQRSAVEPEPPSQAWSAPRRPRWVVPVILGVPLVGMIAFLLVRSLGGPAHETPATAPTAGASTAGAMAPASAGTSTAGASTVGASTTRATTAGTSSAGASTAAPAAAASAAPPVAGAAASSAAPPPSHPPATVERTGTLQLVLANAPAKATILVDGAPYRPDAPLAYGVHRVEVRARGMQPKELEVRIAAPTTTRRIVLAPVKRDEPQGKKGDPLVIPDGDGLAEPGAFGKRP